MERLPVSSFLPKLSFLGPASQEQVLSYLTLLRSRNYARGTLESVTVNLKRLTLHLSAPRRAVLTHDLAHTTSQDITDFVHRAQAAGLAPSTINLTLSFLTEFFDFLREEGRMQLQPVSRHRHRLLAPSTLPKPIADSDLAAFFKVIDAVRDRLIFLLMLRCGLRVSEVCALTWSAIDFDGLTIRIDNSKGQVDRVAYIAPDIEKALKLWHACGTTGDYPVPRSKAAASPAQQNPNQQPDEQVLAVCSALQALLTPLSAAHLRDTVTQRRGGARSAQRVDGSSLHSDDAAVYATL